MSDDFMERISKRYLTLRLKDPKSGGSILIVVLLILFYLVTGTLRSGFHLTDDKEAIVMANDLKTASLIDVSEKWINQDLQIRLRPFYFFHRVLQTKLFGTNYYYWSWYTAA